MDPRIDPKPELLVFNKKEITVIIVLLVLVALFSFTLGLRMGKMLANAKPQGTEQAPLTEKPATPTEGAAAEEHPGEGAAKAEDHAEEAKEGAKEGATEAQKAEDKSEAISQVAENQADNEFAAETSKEKVKVAKPVPMALPREKKGEGYGGPRYTLQVGSHRTVAEAAEQVSALKHKSLDAFYLEAKVPGKGTWYRVGIGLYNSKELAEQSAAKLRATGKGLPSFIVQKIE